MLRQRVPSAMAMTLGLLGVMWLDAWVEGWGLPGLVMLLGMLTPAAWLASREIGVLMYGAGVGVGPGRKGRGRVLFTGAAAGLAVGAGTMLPVWLSNMTMSIAERFVFAAAIMPGFMAVFLGWVLLGLLRRAHSAQGAIHIMCALGAGFVFLGLPLSAWLWGRFFMDPWGLAAAVLVIKSCDIGAYFTGRFLGRHKLIPWLSPGKTWEGLVGGLAASALVCLWFEPALTGKLQELSSSFEGWPWWFALMAGAVLGYVGQLGDLFASALKRDAGVKDFARTIPGFGGVMDVMDSLLLAGPVVLALMLLGRFAG